MKKKGRIGSSLDDFLTEEGVYEDVTARAIKRVIAYQLDRLMADLRGSGTPAPRHSGLRNDISLRDGKS